MKTISKAKLSRSVILGVDPGTAVTGYALGLSEQSGMKLITSGVIQLHKFEDHYTRLHHIYHRINQVISEYKPDELAIEAPFYGKNVQSMLKLGRAQGVAITVALARGIPVHEYSPRKIKQVITGNGNASKDQVAVMCRQQLDIKEVLQTMDESDAIATALCHHFQKSNPANRVEDGSSGLTKSGTKKKSRKRTASDWKKFVDSNPDRVAD